MSAPAPVSDLAEEYGRRLREAAGAQLESDWAWLWYLTKLWERSRDPGIFQLCQRRPKEHGLANIWLWVRGEITLRELYTLLREQTADLYAEQLEQAGVAVFDRSRDYDALTRETALEAVKAVEHLQGAEITPGVGCPDAVAEAAATIWLRFVELYHALAGLPSIAELVDWRVMIEDSAVEADLLASGDFSKFAITDPRERDRLEDLVAGEAVPVEIPSR